MNNNRSHIMMEYEDGGSSYLENDCAETLFITNRKIKRLKVLIPSNYNINTKFLSDINKLDFVDLKTATGLNMELSPGSKIKIKNIIQMDKPEGIEYDRYWLLVYSLIRTMHSPYYIGFTSSHAKAFKALKNHYIYDQERDITEEEEKELIMDSIWLASFMKPLGIRERQQEVSFSSEELFNNMFYDPYYFWFERTIYNVLTHKEIMKRLKDPNWKEDDINNITLVHRKHRSPYNIMELKNNIQLYIYSGRYSELRSLVDEYKKGSVSVGKKRDLIENRESIRVPKDHLYNKFLRIDSYSLAGPRSRRRVVYYIGEKSKKADIKDILC